MRVFKGRVIYVRRGIRRKEESLSKIAVRGREAANGTRNTEHGMRATDSKITAFEIVDIGSRSSFRAKRPQQGCHCAFLRRPGQSA